MEAPNGTWDAPTVKLTHESPVSNSIIYTRLPVHVRELEIVGSFMDANRDPCGIPNASGAAGWANILHTGEDIKTPDLDAEIIAKFSCEFKTLILGS